MATQIDTVHILGFAAMTSVAGEVVTISSAAYTAVVSDLEERDELAEGGIRKIQQVRVGLSRSSLSSVPTIWSGITVRSQNLQVLNVSQDAAVVELTCGGLAE